METKFSILLFLVLFGSCSADDESVTIIEQLETESECTSDCPPSEETGEDVDPNQ